MLGLLQAYGGHSRARPLSRLQNGNGASLMSPAPAWATPARRPAYPEHPPASPGPSLPPGAEMFCAHSMTSWQEYLPTRKKMLSLCEVAGSESL